MLCISFRLPESVAFWEEQPGERDTKGREEGVGGKKEVEKAESPIGVS
jgi:hypothetical protein